MSRGRLWRQLLRRQCQMLSAQGRGPSAARERVGWLAVTTAEQVFSLAWSSVKRRRRPFSGLCELNDGPVWVISGCAGPSAARQVKLKKRTPELDRADLKLRNLL